MRAVVIDLVAIYALLASQATGLSLAFQCSCELTIAAKAGIAVVPPARLPGSYTGRERM